MQIVLSKCSVIARKEMKQKTSVILLSLSNYLAMFGHFMVFRVT